LDKGKDILVFEEPKSIDQGKKARSPLNSKIDGLNLPR
jgi:hypothetical protein